MKKILVIVLAVILVLSLSLTSVVFAAGGKKEVTLAQEAGQAWLDNMVALTGEPLEWTGARLTAPQVCYDLKGKPNAYIFTMENDGEVVGYIVVGSSAYGYPMFEAADVPPPSIPSADEVKSTLKRDLALDVASIGRPTRLLYLGFDNLFAVYQAGQQEVAVNLKFDFATPASNLKAAMPSPEVYRANIEASEQSPPEVLSGSTSTAQSSSYRWGLLTMTAYNEDSEDCYGYKCNCCGPCSGVSIGRYYREEVDRDGDGNPDYPDLPVDWAGCSEDDRCYDAMYKSLFDHMQTGYLTCATSLDRYGPGFEDMTEEYGYSNFDYENDYSVRANDYWKIAGYIDNGWPTALKATKFFEDIDEEVPDWPPTTGHFVAIKGYLPPFCYYTYCNYYYAIVCTDSYTGTDNLWLNWDHLGWGLFTCTIKD